jgi:hypothetical protein
MDEGINLIVEVDKILRTSGLNKNADELMSKLSSHLDDNNVIHRHELNRYFNLVLMGLPVNTIEHRYCLIPNGTFSAWLNIFKLKILPLLLENDV